MAEKSALNFDDLYEDDEFPEEPAGSLADLVPPKYEIQTNIWPILEANVPKNSRRLMKFIGDFRDRNIRLLETPYPLDCPVWYDKACQGILYETMGIDENDLYKYTQNIEGVNGYIDPYLKKGHGKSTKIHQFAMFMLLRYYESKSKSENDENFRYATAMKYFIAYYQFIMSYQKFFKSKGHPPIPQVMVYTINNLSYRNKLRQFGSVHKWIYYAVDSTCTTYHKRLERGADFDYLYVLDKLRDKFKEYMKVLYREYDKNYRQKNLIFESKTFTADGELFDTTSTSAEILGLAEKYTNRFFDNPINEVAIKAAVNKGNKAGWIPEKDLRNTIYLLADSKDNQPDIREFYQALFYIFFHLPDRHYQAKDIHSKAFIVEMQKTYKPGNSQDENRIVVRDMIDKWLKVGSTTYRTTNRQATLSIFRRSIFDYFIFKTAMD